MWYQAGGAVQPAAKMRLAAQLSACNAVPQQIGAGPLFAEALYYVLQLPKGDLQPLLTVVRCIPPGGAHLGN